LDVQNNTEGFGGQQTGGRRTTQLLAAAKEKRDKGSGSTFAFPRPEMFLKGSSAGCPIRKERLLIPAFLLLQSLGLWGFGSRVQEFLSSAIASFFYFSPSPPPPFPMKIDRGRSRQSCWQFVKTN
jgi:hypothetical protein